MHKDRATNSNTQRQAAWRLSLRWRILALLAGLALLSLAGSLGTTWYSASARGMVTDMAGRDLQLLRTAQELEMELALQRGYATYFFLSGDEAWLNQLELRTEGFLDLLRRARVTSFTTEGTDILERIARDYEAYRAERDRVIELYRQGRREQGALMHWKVRERYDGLLDLTAGFLRLHEANVAATVKRATNRANMMMTLSWVGMAVSVLLVLVLGYILIRQVLAPIRRLLAAGPAGAREEPDVIRALDQRMTGLMTNVDRAKEQVMHAEKLALAGKLAAGVAHSIRNPLTSVKMRVFSLSRTLRLDEAQKDDFDVISEEVGHIDTIVQHFLEFARPPKLSTAHASPSDVVDTALVLLRHRLGSYGVTVELERDEPLPPVPVDADQLKEALVNILLNACEAMPHGGGRITIAESVRRGPDGPEAVVAVRDTGPGIPPAVLPRVFEPFYSTKEDGSGLGLAIAKRILTEHGGGLTVTSTPGQGAQFVLALPCKETSRHG